jgi:multidrug resistance efflux pump
MGLSVDPAVPEAPDGARRAAKLLVTGAVLLLAAAGLLLWWSRGATVFAEVLLAAVAWCF